MLHKHLAGHRSHIRSILSIMLCLALVCGTVASMSVFAAEPETAAETAVEETSTENTAGETTVATETSAEADSIVSSESTGEMSSEEVTETPTEKVTETSTESVTEGVTEQISEAATEKTELTSEEETSAAAESITLSLGNSVSATADDTITLTGSSGSNHSWTVTGGTGSATITYNNATAYVTGVSEGTVTVTHTYKEAGSGQNRTESYTVTVTAGSSTIKVYVYVSASGMSDEMLELLGIDPDTLDGNGFFPAGEITLDGSYLSGKNTTTGAALINSTSDWVTVLAALSNMDTSTLTGEYAENRGNNVPDYLNQAEQDIDGYIGSGYSALFRWNMTTSYGFEDQTVQYHLDLRFSTKTITFITGNNGITSGTATDGTTVDSRTYITGSIIQDPRNLNIPDGYKFAGYYTDAAMTNEWDGIGTALNENTVVYIKLVPLTDVTINYVVQVGKGTVTDPSSSGVASQTGMEHFNPVTGASSIEGSTATASTGYKFDGWYSDEACTVQVSESVHYTPSTPSGGWKEGDEYTYYAKFVPTTTCFAIQVAKLRLMKSNYDSQRYRLEDDICVNFPKMIAATTERIAALKSDQMMVESCLPKGTEDFALQVGGKVYTNRKEAGQAIIAACSGMKAIQKEGQIGNYAGFGLSVHFDAFENKFELSMLGEATHKVEIGADPSGNITRINNALESIPAQVKKAEERLETLQGQMESAKEEVQRPFAQADELRAKEERLTELNALLNMDGGNESREAAIGESTKERLSADRPAGKGSIMEKLQQMKKLVRTSGEDAPTRTKQKEEVL